MQLYNHELDDRDSHFSDIRASILQTLQTYGHIHVREIMAGQSLEAKIVVLGSQGVGKTSLVARYVKNQFNPSTTVSTVGASFLTKRVVDEDSDTTVRLQIWDTAGQERFRYIYFHPSILPLCKVGEEQVAEDVCNLGQYPASTTAARTPVSSATP